MPYPTSFQTAFPSYRSVRPLLPADRHSGKGCEFSQLDFMLLLYSYQMIFSVKWHFTCAANCDVTLHKIASEHTTARGGPAKF